MRRLYRPPGPTSIAIEWVARVGTPGSKAWDNDAMPLLAPKELRDSGGRRRRGLHVVCVGKRERRGLRMWRHSEEKSGRPGPRPPMPIWRRLSRSSRSFAPSVSNDTGQVKGIASYHLSFNVQPWPPMSPDAARRFAFHDTYSYSLHFGTCRQHCRTSRIRAFDTSINRCPCGYMLSFCKDVISHNIAEHWCWGVDNKAAARCDQLLTRVQAKTRNLIAMLDDFLVKSLSFTLRVKYSVR
jgi:hypothetical protein